LLRNLLDGLIAEEYSARLAGNLKVTSGDVGVGSALFAKCACLGVSVRGSEYSCGDCGREIGNYLWLQSGDGAGSYPVIEIRSKSQELVGAFVVFDSPLASSPTIQNQIATGQLSAIDSFGLAKLKSFGDLRALRLGELIAPEEILVADVRQFHDKSDDFSRIALTDAAVIAFCEPMSKSDLARKANDMLSDAPEAPRPRVLAVLSSSLAQLVTVGEEYVVEDWSSQVLTWRTSMINTEIVTETNAVPAGSAAFCTQCGVQFLKPDQKFCQMCGAPAV
jgi:hypothetical protein